MAKQKYLKTGFIKGMPIEVVYIAAIGLAYYVFFYDSGESRKRKLVRVVDPTHY